MKALFLSAIACTLCSFSLLANNIQLANTSLSGQNTGSHFKMVGFDVSWDNSWRTSSNEQNWDAAWVFIKFRKKGATAWQHATLNYVQPGDAASSGHTAGAGASIKTSSDGKGVFIYRSTDGIGNVSYTGNKLRWNYGADGVLDSDSVEVNVFALEMVYVTEGSYYLGSTGNESAHFRRGDKDTAFLVSSNNAISLGTATNNLYWSPAGYGGSASGTISAAFPKGFKAFYCMKYECSQQQYVDFLNNIDAAKASVRNIGIFTGTHPALTASFPERAAGNIGASDVSAYCDWAALRPITEMEYEKACRGYNMNPVAGEYAWGNTTINYTTTVSDEGTISETATDGNAHYYTAINHPLRVGAYATASSTRVSSGGSYYGIMEMSGNVWEQVISVGTSTGRAVTGVHGDGMLGPDGNTDITELSNNDAYGFRGGGYTNGANPDGLQVSNRYFSGPYDHSRSLVYGLRAVRTAE